MAEIRHKRRGVLIEEPRNWADLKLSKNFLDKNDDVNFNIGELLFAGDEAIKIKKRVLNGLAGGVGIFEGDKYEIEIGDISDPVAKFEGYLDYAAGVDFINCNELRVQLKKMKGSDWLTDKADAFSFRFLQDEGEISASDYTKVPYMINYIPDGVQLLMISMSLFMMTKELIESIRGVAEAIADVTDAAIPVVGVGVGVGAVAVTAWDLGNFVLVTIKLIAQIVYTIAIGIAIGILIKQLFEQLMPKLRYHLGMSIQTMFSKACAHLGLTLSSDLLQKRKGWVLIPTKNHKGGKKPKGFKGDWLETGVPSLGDPTDKFGDLIRVFSRVFNARHKIKDDIFYFERIDHFNSVGDFKIGDFFTDQDELKDLRRPNSEEMVANYNINWKLDTQDQNTLENVEGLVYQAIVRPNSVEDADLVNITGLEEIAIPFSQGLRKDSLSGMEEVLSALGGFVDKLTGVFGSGTNFKSKVEARKGALLLSSHFLTIPKMVVMDGTGLSKNQRDLLSAKKLWDELHYINSFVEFAGVHNQWYRYKGVKVPFCIKDFVSLIENEFCKDPENKEAMIEALDWEVEQDFAIIDYRVNEKYTNNLQLKFLE